MKKHSLKISDIVISYLIFIAIWLFRKYFVDYTFLNDYVEYTLNFILYGLTWLGFSLLLLNIFKEDMVISAKEMFTTFPKRKYFIPLVLAVIIYYSISYSIAHRLPEIKINRYDFVMTILGVGIFEESLFRGWFLNSLLKFTTPRIANVISAIMFVTVHFPKWLTMNIGIFDFLQNTVFVFLLGLIFGLCFRKTKSIWFGAIIHSLWDLFAMMY